MAGAAGAATAPTFTDSAAPAPLGQDAGEPSIGVNWNTGNVLFQAGLHTLKGDFSGTTPRWTDVSSPLTSVTGLDPILFTDHDTGRTFVSQLLGACSLMAYSDDDGANWTPTPIGCGLGAPFAPRPVGGGAFHPGTLGPVTSYKHTV